MAETKNPDTALRLSNITKLRIHLCSVDTLHKARNLPIECHAISTFQEHVSANVNLRINILALYCCLAPADLGLRWVCVEVWACIEFAR